jgi:thiol:disulfide interchange protein DsbC
MTAVTRIVTRIITRIAPRIVTGLGILISLMVASNAIALSPTELKAKLNQIRPELKVTSIEMSDLPGFYDVILEGDTRLLVKEDASYFIAGDLYRIEESRFVNVSEEDRNVMRRELIAAVDESEMVIFSPREGLKKASVTVFTDIDCGYCRKLHKEVPELNRLGIEVRYLAYPRAGVDSDSYDKYVSAWCADNKQIGITKAKLGKEIEKRTCANPVAAQYELGNKIGVRGTPALVYEDGTLQPGYLPADQLAIRLGIN